MPHRTDRHLFYRRAAVYLLLLMLLAPAGAFGVWAAAWAQSSSEDTAGSRSGQSQPLKKQTRQSAAQRLSLLTENWEKRYQTLHEEIKLGKASREEADKFYQELSADLAALRKQLREAMQKWVPAPLPDSAESAAKQASEPEGSASSKPDRAADSTPQASTPTSSMDVEAQSGSAAPGPMSSGTPPPPISGSTERPLAVGKPGSPVRAFEISAEEIESAEALKSALLKLYDIRVRLLANDVSRNLRNRVTGTGLEGVRELTGELDHIELRFEFNARLAGYMGTRILRDLLQAPLPLIGSMIVLIVAVVLFSWWRKWAGEGIPGLRHRLLSGQDRNPVRINLARFLWYFDHARAPIEWFVLLSFFFDLVNVREIQAVGDLVWTTVKWILLAWLAVRLIDAFAARNTGFKTKSAHLRLRSIWLVTSWLMLLGLGLSLTNELAGRATLYAWIWMIFEIFVLPIAAILIYMWREEIFSRLEEDHLLPVWLDKMLGTRKGVNGILAATIGAAYLCFNQLRVWALKAISSFEGGRLLLANLLQLEAGRSKDKRDPADSTEPLPAALRDRLIRGQSALVESVGARALEFLVDRMTWPNGGTIVVVAERGGGKSQLLKRLKAESQEKMMLIDCPPGGLDALYDVFLGALGIEDRRESADLIGRAIVDRDIRAIGIDNMHRLSRPFLGGQKELDCFYDLIRSLPQKVLWIFGIDRASWQYISRARANKTFLDRLIDLNPWSERQISELIENRCKEAQIQPDFSKLVMPHQFDDAEYDTMEERNRNGVYRILWNASEGNPVVALRLWADSLRVSPDGAVVVCFPTPPTTRELENVGMTGLLVLRVIIESGLASRQEILESLRLPEEEVAGALRYAESRGWIENVDGRYQLTWKWFRAVTRVLSRQNLLFRKTLGDSYR